MSLKLLPFAVVVLTLGIQTSLIRAQEPAATKPASAADAELAAIRKQSDSFVTAFNKKDAKAIAQLWTKDGEYIDEKGERFIGREAIEKCYLDFFTMVSDPQISLASDSLRLVGSTIAIEDGIAVMKSESANSVSHSKYHAVHTKVDGQWLMVSAQDEAYEPPSDERSAADLEWLVGTWETENVGNRSQFVCEWVADGHFLQRRYTTHLVDGKVTTGLQIIGWNPMSAHVQSWDFSSTGGHAVGVWEMVNGGWQSQLRGTTADGAPTYAVNTVERLDDNAYVWRSTERMVGENHLPDTDEVIFKRIKK